MTNIAILCGGKSVEHEVSLISAQNVIAALDKNKYQIKTIFINKAGSWFLLNSPDLLQKIKPNDLDNEQYSHKLSINIGDKKSLLNLAQNKENIPIDIIFPVLHGSNGEDGLMQGFLELADVPYVGAGVLGSAICMDKAIAKNLLRAARVPVAKFLVFSAHEKIDHDKVIKRLGLPLFVKPANTGSSVGIVKVKKANELEFAINQARKFDNKIIIEEFIAGREIECAVLGNGKPQASLPGEIIPKSKHEFYTYEAKYLDPEGAELFAPANLPKPIIKKIQNLAKKVFSILNCEGMARIDFFLTPDNKIYLNEANTIPGFTQISMYPKLWTVTGLPYAKLIDKLVDLAFDRYKQKQTISTNRL